MAGTIECRHRGYPRREHEVINLALQRLFLGGEYRTNVDVIALHEQRITQVAIGRGIAGKQGGDPVPASRISAVAL